MKMKNINNCGLGLRNDFIFEMPYLKQKPSWLEIVPENWIDTPKKYQKIFEQIANEYQLVAHGLSLSIGSCEPLDMVFLKQIKEFLNKYEIEHYSEHLSFSSLENQQTYELLPLPMTKQEVNNVCEKVDIIQNYLKRELILENATYYYVPSSTMSEIEFINDIFQKSGAKMLLDINNVFVNSFNHKFDPYKYIDSLDMGKVVYYHVAGHLEYKENLWIDTHGTPVKDEVWDLTKYCLQKHKVPALLERDNNIPPLDILMDEYNILKSIYDNF
ncbi:FIG023677: hypothetical protein [hydrothermal vent metagenome]|uniref:Uncharacterized protein n=1 Tax=hydrothermal vent metagenome TaxID=652676 RepID=A0A3B1E9E7_9ZZZZ